MAYCPTVVKSKDCEREKENFDEEQSTHLAGALLAGGLLAGGVAAALVTKHRPLVIKGCAAGALISSAVVGRYIYVDRMERKMLTEKQYRPCTSIFDTFRFTIHPSCYSAPREKPYIFYDKEPAKPILDSTWTENFVYDNMPRPNHCRKEKIIEHAKKLQESEEYGNKPEKGQCPTYNIK